MASKSFKFCVVSGYLVFFSLLAWIIYETTMFETIEVCDGPAFVNSPEYGTGNGRCSRRFSFYSTLFQLDERDKNVFYGTLEESQGIWKNGKRHGFGTFTRFSVYFTPNEPPFEGDDKLDISGYFDEDDRHGYGLFQIQQHEFYRSLKWGGNYTRNDLTCKNGELDFLEIHKPEFFRKRLPYVYPFQWVNFRGHLQHSLMHGNGTLQFGDIRLPDLEFKDGLLVRAHSPFVLTYKSSNMSKDAVGVSVKCEIKEVSQTNTKPPKPIFAMSCDTKQVFKWNGEALSVVSTPTIDSDVTDFVETQISKIAHHFSIFQSVFLENSKHNQDFVLPLFPKSKKKS